MVFLKIVVVFLKIVFSWLIVMIAITIYKMVIEKRMEFKKRKFGMRNKHIKEEEELI